MLCASEIPAGVVVASAGATPVILSVPVVGVIACVGDDTDTLLMSRAELKAMLLADTLDPALLGINVDSVAFVYSWGVAAVLGLWMVGYAISAGVTAIRKA
jgi:hypothetical protein